MIVNKNIISQPERCGVGLKPGIENAATYFPDENHRNLVSSAFPSFEIPKNRENSSFGYVSFGNVGWGRGYGQSYGYFKQNKALIHQGLQSGPLLLFQPNGLTIGISSASNHMVHSFSAPYQKIEDWPIFENETEYRGIHLGLQSSVVEIPKNFELETILSFKECPEYKTIYCGLQHWGDRLLEHQNKKKLKDYGNDLIRDYIGYWTDKGAYYYYNTDDDNGNYDETIRKVANHFEEKNIPFRYIHYDSWWYPKGSDKGCKNWTAVTRPTGENYNTYFKSMENVYTELGYPISAHGRHWSNENDYLKDYKFLIGNDSFTEARFSLPLEERFWDDLFQNAKKWGLISYQQDHLNDQWLKMGDSLLQSATVADQWLFQMNRAAARHDINILYCMPMVKHVMASTALDQVRYLRVSPDYHFDASPQWLIGMTNMLAEVVGLGGFKDTFYTTSFQPGGGNSDWYSVNETRTELQSLVATFSSGQVGPGDGIGYMNRDLIMKSCNDNGLILRPENTLKPIDSSIKKRALPKAYPDAPKGHVWRVYTDIADLRFTTVFASDNIVPFRISPLDVENLSDDLVIWQSYPNEDSTFQDFSSENKYKIKGQNSIGGVDWSLYQVASKIEINRPFQGSGKTVIVFIGEIEKWTRVSRKRIENLEIIHAEAEDIELKVVGAQYEKVTFSWWIGGEKTRNNRFEKVEITCIVNGSGYVKIRLASMECLENGEEILNTTTLCE